MTIGPTELQKRMHANDKCLREFNWSLMKFGMGISIKYYGDLIVYWRKHGSETSIAD